MKKILLFSFVLLTALVSESWAQERTISGKVTSVEDGSTLPGVNVVLKGTTNGTITDVDGNYSVSVPSEGGTLTFSFIGLTTEEIEIGARSVIDLAMSADVKQLSEVVVTALGGERNSAEVVYANQTLTSDDLLSSPNKNALEAMRGKAAGVRLSQSSGSVGSSSRIVLRGEGSLTGNNNALIVIDGIPIDNDATQGGENLTNASRATSGYADHGNRFNDLNPDDIESLTILKGPSATSLYGSRGASGVILITTKKGSSNKGGGMQIKLNSSFSVEEVYSQNQRQDQFGQGYDNANFDSGENWSWGPAFDGVVRPWTSAVDADGDGQFEWLARPYSNAPDQVKGFFDTGHTLSNSVSLSGANEGFSYYISYSNTDQDGILANTDYKRNTITVNSTAKLSDRINSTFKLSYANVQQNTAQEGSRAFEGNNAYSMLLQSPVNIPFNELRDYTSPFHGTDGYWGSYSSVNPYFILNEYGNQGNINNVLGNASLSYNVMEGLDLVARVGTNLVSTDIQTWTPKFIPTQQILFGDDQAITTRTGQHESLGDYGYNHILTNNTDVSLLASYARDINEDFKFDVSLGYNFFQRTTQNISGNTNGGLLVPGVYNLANSNLSSTSRLDRSKYRIVGALANARVGYKDAIFLELSARNDWSSTLVKENNQFFYNAVGFSAILTDLIDIDDNIINFAKVRGSIGSTGKDAPLYVLNSTFASNVAVFGGSHPVQFPINGQAASTVGNRIGNPDLSPEKTTTYEFGVDLGFWGERVNLEYTYYKSNHKDQIVTVSLPNTSGFTTTSRNVGEMTNTGHEIALRLRPIYGLIDGLKMELFATYSKNVNEVVTIADGIDELSFGTYTPGVTIVAKEGLPYGTFKALAPKTNAAGQVLVNGNTGFPILTDTEQYVGNYQPDFTSSFGTNINYKGIGFNVLFDLKQGGNFVSQTQFYTEFNGTALHTAEYNREPYIFPNSVIDNGDGTTSPNTIEITEQDYFTNYDPAASTYLVDASYLKLREIGVSYDLPSSLIGKMPFSSARVALFAKNVKFWLPEENTFADPEGTNGSSLTGNASGIETTQTPPSRSFGVNLQLTF